MGLLYITIYFLSGLFVGSFLNVIADRLSTGKNPFVGRSQCDFCQKKLGYLDLVPVFSFLLLKGKCRFCKKSLSLYYPLSELFTGIIFALVVFIFGLPILNSISYWIAILFNLYIVSSLVVIFLTDIKYGLIPFKVVIFALLGSFMYFSVFYPTVLAVNIITGSGAFVIFLFLFLVTKGRGMGLGDVVYVFLMGFLLGFPLVILGMYIAFISGAIISLILVINKRKKIKGGTIPFGPFLVSGTFISMFWGDFIISKILGYLHL